MMSSSSLKNGKKKKLNISMGVIKKKMQASEPNLSHSLINRDPSPVDEPSPKIQIHETTADFAISSNASTVIRVMMPQSKPSPKKLMPRRSVFHNHNPRYLTSMNRQSIPSNADGKAMVFLPFICFFCVSQHIKIFYLSWIALFVCFLSWIMLSNMTFFIPLSNLDFHLTANHKSIAIILQYSTGIIFSIFFGDQCDKLGARYSYILLFILSFITLIPFIFLQWTPVTYVILSCFVGITAASFVITQYHIVNFFSSKCIGIASGVCIGYGVFTAQLTVSLLLYVADVFETKLDVPLLTSWQYFMIIPLTLMIIMIFVYYFFTIESPKGNISKENINLKLIFLIKRYKWKRILSDYRMWILSLSYGLCFGIELTLLHYSFSYFTIEYNTNLTYRGLFALNLVTRGFGGYISDFLYFKYGLKGRVYCLFCALFFESMFILNFSLNLYGFNYSLLMMIFAICYCQIAEGIVFSIVPNLPHQLYIGLCLGVVAAGGPFMSMFFAIAFKYVPSHISYQTAWILCSVLVLFGSLTVLLVKFTDKEIADDLRMKTNEFWSSVGTKFRSDSDIKEDTNTKSPGFVIH